jgi:hypothetical protein
MGVALCHTLDANIIKFEWMILDQSQKKQLGKNHTGLITVVQTFKGTAA